ncbi:MAG: hypothetical protein ACR2P0_04720 [Acidimicrobiales bacterium]
MSKRLALIMFLIAFLAAACASEGLPNSYDDQDERARRQFVAACEDSLVDSDHQNPGSFCECAFYTVAAELTFAEFLDLDEKLKDDPGSLTQEERNLLDSVSLPCQFSAVDINDFVAS